MKMNLKKGFTLIELLVVVAIIGVLASVVLASLNTARTKGTDAAIKANMANARAQAAIFYDSNTVAVNTYTSVCTNGPIGSPAVNGIGANVQAASTAAGTGTIVSGLAGAASALQTTLTSNCHDNATAWAAEVPLKTASAGYFCVDSNGAGLVTTTPLAASTSPGGTTGLSCL